MIQYNPIAEGDRVTVTKRGEPPRQATVLGISVGYVTKSGNKFRPKERRGLGPKIRVKYDNGQIEWVMQSTLSESAEDEAERLAAIAILDRLRS